MGFLDNVDRQESDNSILAVDDNPESLFVLRKVLEQAGFSVRTAGGAQEALVALEDSPPILIVLDVVMPGVSGFEFLQKIRSYESLQLVPVIMLTARSSLEDVVQGLQSGADDYISKPYEPLELVQRIRAALRVRELMNRLQSAEARNEQLLSQINQGLGFYGIVGQSPAMQRVFALLEKIIGADSSVLIEGSSGTGKELVARAIHFQSSRKHKPFIVKNCAGLSEQLADAELFGYARGSFTGAYRDHRGLFEAANGGTLFLDEIGEIPLAVQGKLLRVLQGGGVLPVGSTLEKRVDVRVVAATNSNLKRMVSLGKFREDLFYRINVLHLELPSLSERREDIPILVKYFLEKFCERRGQPVPAVEEEVMQALARHSWKGNVRELQNEVERMLIFAAGRSSLGLDLISAEIRPDSFAATIVDSRTEHSSSLRSLKEAAEILERKMISSALQDLSGNRSQVARRLGISRSNLIAKIKTYNLD